MRETPWFNVVCRFYRTTERASTIRKTNRCDTKLCRISAVLRPDLNSSSDLPSVAHTAGLGQIRTQAKILEDSEHQPLHVLAFADLDQSGCAVCLDARVVDHGSPQAGLLRLEET